LFYPLQGKDMFEEFYKAELARRLLLQRFSSIDLEKAAIARLKTVLVLSLLFVSRVFLLSSVESTALLFFYSA
jgi:protein-S-isoprenylcysteine O-methyltransferase Ste14